MFDNLGIYKSPEDKWIFGVCSGFAKRYNLNPLWVRAGVVAAVLAPFGVSLVPVGIGYIVLGILLPSENDSPPNQT